jgi:hypothetical protein
MIAAAAVVAAAGAAVAVVATRGEGTGPATTAAITELQTASPSASETARAGGTGSSGTVNQETADVTAVPLSELVWTPLVSESLQGADDGEINRVAATSDGTVIGAGSERGTGGHDVAFWVIPDPDDGATVGTQVLSAGGDEVAFGLITTAADEAVAVGYRQENPPRGPLSAAVWLLTQDSWESVSDGLPSPTSAYEKMNRIAADEAGTVVAVGNAGPGYGEGGVPLATDAAVWVSSDGGTTWARVEEPSFGGDGYQELRGVAAYDSGFVAVGHDRSDAAVWRSDGERWLRIEGSAGLTTSEGRADLDMRDLVAFQGGLVAVGDVSSASGEKDGAVWGSPDGDTWTLVEAAAFGGPRDQQILGVASASRGLVAVGCSSCDSAGATPAVWTSVDGQTWTRTGETLLGKQDVPQAMRSVAGTPDVLVAAGWSNREGGQDAAVWSAAG